MHWPVVTIGGIQRSQSVRILALRIPDHDLTGYEVVFFEDCRPHVGAIDVTGRTAWGPFLPLETLPHNGDFLGDIEKLRRLLPYLTALQKCGERTKPIVKAAPKLRSLILEQSGIESDRIGALTRRCDSFATLIVLGEADVILLEKSESPDGHILRAFVTELSKPEPTLRQLRSFLTMSCLLDDEKFYESLRFESLAKERPLQSIRFAPLSANKIDDYVAVMRKANERTPPAFDDPVDFEHAREEMAFCLRPDTQSIPLQGLFSRVDCWIAQVEGKTCGAIGLAIFSSPASGCWVTWYATQPGHQGLGAQLMALVVSVARSRGFPTLFVWTGPESETALSVYKRMGFRPTDNHPPDLVQGAPFAAFERDLGDFDDGYPTSLATIL